MRYSYGSQVTTGITTGLGGFTTFGGSRVNVRLASSAAATLTQSDNVLLLTTGTPNRVVTLPSATSSTVGTVFTLIKADSAAGFAMLQPTGADALSVPVAASSCTAQYKGTQVVQSAPAVWSSLGTF